MRGSSRHGSSRPDRARGRAGAAAAPHRDPRHSDIPAELVGLLEPVVRAAGMDLESVRVSAAGRRRLLRVVVDADGGVSLDDIALISRDLSARLDASGAMGETPYTLEVSSPGVDRPLTEPRHWRRATGRLVSVALTSLESPDPVPRTQAGERAGWPAPAARVEGRVIVAGDQGVTLEVDGDQREFGYAELGPGRVQVEFGRLEDRLEEPAAGDAAAPAAAGMAPAADAAPAAAAGPGTRGRADGH